MALSIPTITLNDGRAMPLLGLGTYKSTEKEAEKAIVTAAKYGYRLIDTASSYKNEDSIGRGDPRKRNSAGKFFYYHKDMEYRAAGR